MFEKLFDKKKTRNLKDIDLNEVSLVDSPANGIPFLIVKRENGIELNDLDELLSCETFSDEQVGTIDLIMKQLDFLDNETASAIGDLLLAVTSRPEIAKSCEMSWPSITGIDTQVTIKYLAKTELSDWNVVDIFIQKFVNNVLLDNDALEVIGKALEVIRDLDDESLDAVYSLLKTEFSEKVVTRIWPTLFEHLEDSETEIEDSEPVEKSGLMWPSISGRIQKDDNTEQESESISKNSEAMWPSISCRDGLPEPVEKNADAPLWPSISGRV